MLPTAKKPLICHFSNLYDFHIYLGKYAIYKGNNCIRNDMLLLYFRNNRIDFMCKTIEEEDTTLTELPGRSEEKYLSVVMILLYVF